MKKGCLPIKTILKIYQYFYKNLLKQFNFQQKHSKFVFLSISLQKIETYSNGIKKCTYIG